MEDKENYEEFVDELKTRNDPVEKGSRKRCWTRSN